MNQTDFASFKEAFAYFRNHGYSENDAYLLASRSVSTDEYRLFKSEIFESVEEFYGE